MFEVSELLAQSNVVRSGGFPLRRRTASPVLAWLIAGLIAAVYLALAVAALKHPVPDEWQVLAGPTTWTGLFFTSIFVFMIVGGALTAFQWTVTRGGRRRFRPRPPRLLDV